MVGLAQLLLKYLPYHRPILRDRIWAEGWNCPTISELDARRVSLNPSSANYERIGRNRTNYKKYLSFRTDFISTTEKRYLPPIGSRGVTLWFLYYPNILKNLVCFLELFSIRTQTYTTNIRKKIHISKEKSNYFCFFINKGRIPTVQRRLTRR